MRIPRHTQPDLLGRPARLFIFQLPYTLYCMIGGSLLGRRNLLTAFCVNRAVLPRVLVRCSTLNANLVPASVHRASDGSFSLAGRTIPDLESSMVHLLRSPSKLSHRTPVHEAARARKNQELC
jgi:hypothetical protein